MGPINCRVFPVEISGHILSSYVPSCGPASSQDIHDAFTFEKIQGISLANAEKQK